MDVRDIVFNVAKSVTELKGDELFEVWRQFLREHGAELSQEQKIQCAFLSGFSSGVATGLFMDDDIARRQQAENN